MLTQLFLLIAICNRPIITTGAAYIRFHSKDTPLVPNPPKPSWPDKYVVEGILTMPYADLDEPFTAWYDGGGARSRIDMYGGVTKTVQLADYGRHGHQYQVVPVTTEREENKITCFKTSGSKGFPVKPQSMLPDIVNFTYVGQQYFMGRNFNAWQHKIIDKKYYSTTTFTLYMDENSEKPTYYETLTYSTVDGSLTDKSRIYFTNMALKFDPNVFDAPLVGLKCKDFEVPHHEAMYLSNPMKEFVHPTDTTHVDLMHKLFRQKYKIHKKDEHLRTFHKKKQTFRDNLRYIHSINRRQLSFKLKVNHLAEDTLEEMRRMRGRLAVPWAHRVDKDSKIFDTQSFPAETPEQKDWRLYGAVTSVKDQSRCGSCWSFGSTGTVEGQYFLKTGRLVRLSEQNLMDCSWGFSNQGCDGGIESEAFKYIKKHGIASDEEYGPYLAVDGFCHADQIKNKINITGQVHIKSGDQHALRVALAHVGPIDVGIDSSSLSFTFYSHGVYYEEKCGNTEGDLDHAVLAVGYGTLHGKDYWLIKNSWSTLWGDEGYILMSTKHNNCGVATDANFVTM